MAAMFAACLTLLSVWPTQAVARAVKCIMLYRPVCAELPTTPPKRITYSNACFARAAGAKVLYQGACRTNHPLQGGGCGGQRDPSADPQCKSWTDGCNICQRSGPDASPVCTKMVCKKRGRPRCLLRFDEQL